MKESDIVYETEYAWVYLDKRRNCLTVFKNGSTASFSDSSYPATDDGISLAMARCNYLSKGRNRPFDHPADFYNRPTT